MALSEGVKCIIDVAAEEENDPEVALMRVSVLWLCAHAFANTFASFSRCEA
jgi:hypothetical protein